MPTVASDTADAVAAIHVLEHFWPWEVPGILAEWRRILKPGGKLILELPCMDKICAYIAQSVNQKVPMVEGMTVHPLWGDPKHMDPAMMHKWGYSKQNIMDVLMAAGFQKIEDAEPRYHFRFRDMRMEAIK